MWKTAVWVALMAIGYRDGDSAKLTRVDEAKLAAAVVANVKEGPMAVVTSITRGTEMIKVLERLYGARGVDQKMDLWTQLQFIKWEKKTVLEHVVEFKNLVYDDFVAEFRGKDSKKNAHNARKNHDGKLTWNQDGQPFCFKCDEYGYMAKDCPKKRKRATECEANFIPEGLEDLYRSSGGVY
ncbi:hypothetical protein DL768_010703 [Monosporascus sp. mg162]|nr:hypothetical protein DL768_010703 [Monosporascus sp. mg162]